LPLAGSGQFHFSTVGGEKITIHVPMQAYDNQVQAAMTSWIDPFDMPFEEEGPPVDEAVAEPVVAAQPPPLPGSEDIAFWDGVARLPAGAEVEAVLVKLGVQSPVDMRYLTDQDLITQGVAAVTARKLLAGAGAPGAVAPATAAATATLPAAAAAASAPAVGGGAKSPGAAAAGPPSWSAEETMKFLAKKGVLTTQRTTGQIFCSSFLGGALLGWGCALTTVVAGGTATVLADAPGLLSLLTGAVFPVGLSMVLLSGSELLTGNFVTMALPAWTHPGLGQKQVVSNTWRIWTISGIGNLAGSLFLAGTVFALSVVPVGSPAAAWVAALTVKKCSLPLLTMVGKAACANWLVNVAIFQASSAHTAAAKIAALWLPIMTFVTLGLEHSIANMFLLPLGMFVGADVGILDIAGNIIPVAVGNALGAIIFVAGVQRYSLLRNMVYSKPM